jgi:hypothetical protein
MSRLTTNRKLAAALLKTLARLEADPTLDPQEPAFIFLKCTLLQRLMTLQVSTAEIKSSLHVVEESEREPAKADATKMAPDAAIA